LINIKVIVFFFLDFLQFDVYDFDGDGSHDLIGGFTATLNDLLKAAQGEVSSSGKHFASARASRVVLEHPSPMPEVWGSRDKNSLV
jgi:hypothetical protein